MKGGKTPLGYTIVEVMIVLAISMAMLALAAGFINGRQGKASFNQGANDFASRIQSVANQVADGQFSDIGLDCTTSPISYSAGHEQGFNDQCVFLGKMIYIRNGDLSKPQYDVISVAGDRLYLGNPPTTLTQANPRAIPPLTTTQATPQRLWANHGITGEDTTTVVPTPFNDIYAIGFLLTSQTDNADKSIDTQAVRLYYITNSTVVNETSSTIEAKVITANIHPTSFANICITDGTRYAKIYVSTDDGITTNNSPTDVKLEMNGTTAC